MDRDENKRPAKNHRRDAYAPLEDDPENIDGETGSPNHDPSDAFFAAAPFLNPAAETERHARNLPHWHQDAVWQFVTWRLADSLPQSKLARWRAERDAWLERHPEPRDDATKREYRERFTSQVESWLDAGHGSCVLRHPDCAKIVAGALRYFNGDRYALGAFVIMPNHVHVLFRPATNRSVQSIMHSWKSYTAKAINKILGRTGTLWQAESWDSMVRNQAQFEACLNYIRDNPKFAGLTAGEYVFERFIEIDDSARGT